MKIPAMKRDDLIPKPINFNPLKHHLDYVLQFLEKASAAELKEFTNSLCHNNIDLYSGSLSCYAICRSVMELLTIQGYSDRENYENWIASSRKYRQLTLEDNSVWILLKSDDTDRYIHIHPAKYGPYSIRFKGSTLKTIYQLMGHFKDIPHQPDIEAVNIARMQIGLSPVKRLVPGGGILKCWDYFSKGKKGI